MKSLLDLIASNCNGKYIKYPIRNYSADELKEAFDNFHPRSIIQECSDYQIFRGFLDGQKIILKKFITGRRHENEVRAIRDIVISIQMRNHKNVLKLLGCCLEFPTPAMVLENSSHGVLNKQGGFGDDESLLPWKTRLRIAKQVAKRLADLHTCSSRLIVHLKVTPTSIFLDHDCVPKLCNFSVSKIIPPPEVSKIIPPPKISSGVITEKDDVYDFGVMLFVFLTGKKAVYINDEGNPTKIDWYVWNLPGDAGHNIQRIVDPRILNEVNELQRIDRDREE